MYQLLVLSGGGIKGLSQLGSLQYLIDQSLFDMKQIKQSASTSVGSMTSYLLTIGYTPIEILVYLVNHSILEKIKRNPITDLFNDHGFYDWDTSVGKCLEDMTREKEYNDPPTLLGLYQKTGIELIFTTTNLTKQRVEYLSYRNHPDMTCLQAIRLSSNLPFIFGKCMLLNDEYSDGGILDNFPIESFGSIRSAVVPAEGSDDKSFRLLGITFQLQSEDQPDQPTPSAKGSSKGIIEKIYRILNLPLYHREYEKIQKIGSGRTSYGDDIIELQLDDASEPLYNMMIDTNKKIEMFSLGYNGAKQYFINKELNPFQHLSRDIFE